MAKIEDAKFNADAQIKLETAHDILQHPDKFAEIFVKAAKTQTSVKELIKTSIQDCLTSDPDSRKVLKDLIEKHFNDNWVNSLKTWTGKIALGVWTIIIILITIWLEKKFGK